jgi:hypothetical protein
MKRVNNKTVIASALVVACCSVSACTGTASMFGNGPDFELRGNAEGIDAFYQGVIAEIESAKSPDGKATEASSVWREKTKLRELRYLKSNK